MTIDPFTAYLSGLVALGHDANWVRRYSPALRIRYESDLANGGMPTPFPPTPDPARPAPDRYGEL